MREAFEGKYFGILNVEGEGRPIALFESKESADRELARRRSLASDDDDHLTEFDQVFSCDVVGTFWNSYDPDPRAKDPLGLDEIARIHGKG